MLLLLNPVSHGLVDVKMNLFPTDYFLNKGINLILLENCKYNSTVMLMRNIVSQQLASNAVCVSGCSII